MDLDAYLFGDVLAVSSADLAMIWGGALIVGLILWRFWRALLNATLNEELAFAVDKEIRYVKKDNWRGHPIKRKEILIVIRRFVPGEGEAEQIFELVENQSEY